MSEKPAGIPVEAIIQNEFSNFAKHIHEMYGLMIQDVSFDWREYRRLGCADTNVLQGIRITSKKSL